MLERNETQSLAPDFVVRLLLGAVVLVYVLSQVTRIFQFPWEPLVVGREITASFIAPVIAVTSLINKKVNYALFIFFFISSVEFWFGGTLISILFLFQWWLMLVIIAKAMLQRSPVVHKYMISPWLGAYALYAVASYFKDPVLPTWGGLDDTVGAMAYFKFFSIMLFFITIPAVFSGNGLPKLPRHMLLCSLAVIILQAILYGTGSWQLGLLFGVRPRLWGSAALILEGRWAFLQNTAVVAIICSLSIWHGKKGLSKATRVLLLATAAGCFFSLFFTGTRIWVFGAMGVAMIIFFWNRNYALIVASAGLWFITALIYSNVYVSGIGQLGPVGRAFWIPWLARDSMAAGSLAVSNLEWRVELWEMAIDEIRKNLFWGVGFRYDPYFAIRTLSGASDFQVFWFEKMQNLYVGGTHQLWLGPFVSFGIPGGLFFLMYYFERMIAVFRMRKEAKEEEDLYPLAVTIVAFLIYLTVIGPVDGGTLSLRFFFAAALSHVLQEELRRRRVARSKGADPLMNAVSMKVGPSLELKNNKSGD